MMHKTKKMKIEVGDEVLIEGEEKNKGKWSIKIGEELNKGKDDMGHMQCQALNTKVTHRTTNSEFVFTRTSLRYGKINKYIQGHKPQETKCRCKRILTMKNSRSYC